MGTHRIIFIMPNFRHIRVGDDWVASAADYNAVMDMARGFYGREKAMVGGPVGVGATDSIVLHAVNNTGNDVEVGQALSLSSVLVQASTDLDTFAFNSTWSGGAPQTTGLNGITIEPVANGDVGRVVACGIVAAQVNLQTTSDPYCDFVSGSDWLKGGYLGTYPIVYNGSGSTGLQWCLVYIGPKLSPPILRASLAANLVAGSSPDPYAQVTVYAPNGSAIPGGPFGAVNTFYESGSYGAKCLVMVNDDPSTMFNFPYTLLRVVPALMTTYQPGFDSSGNFTYTAQTFYGAGSSPIASPTTYTTAIDAGNDLERDATTLSVSPSSSTITYGTSVTLTATVGHSSGSGDTTGTVAFYWTPSIGAMVGIGTATLTGGSGAGGPTAALTPTISSISALNGNGTITAVYGGDGNYNSSTGTASLTVNKASTTCTMTTSPGTTTYGGSVVLKAIVATSATTASNGGQPADPSGFVIFKNGSTTIGPFGEYRVSPVYSSGTYLFEGILSIATLPSGSLSLSAQYQGDDNYSSSSGSASLTVNKATLTVTARDTSRLYGSPNPGFDYFMSGFVLGQIQSTATTGTPDISTTADTTTAVGTYTITAAAGSLASTNYTFSYANGTLLINPAPLSVTANNASGPHGSIPALTTTVTGVLNGDNVTSSATTTATSLSPAGSYTITPHSSGTSNYSVSFNSATLTLT